jgi:hypothetical protein
MKAAHAVDQVPDHEKMCSGALVVFMIGLKRRQKEIFDDSLLGHKCQSLQDHTAGCQSVAGDGFACARRRRMVDVSESSFTPYLNEIAGDFVNLIRNRYLRPCRMGQMNCQMRGRFSRPCVFLARIRTHDPHNRRAERCFERKRCLMLNCQFLAAIFSLPHREKAIFSKHCLVPRFPYFCPPFLAVMADAPSI